MHPLAPLSWPWPLPALLVWVLAWVALVAMRWVGMSMLSAWVVATLLGVMGSVWGRTPVRRLLMALGFPLSWWVLTAGPGSLLSGLPAWAWLLPLAAVLLLYPPVTWRDAPLFPTPSGAMDGLAEQVPLPLAGHVLDAGCGLGDGLLAMERAWPEVHLHGLERSWPLRWLCALRCRTASVRQGDMWQADWSRYDLVYVFQRPESMARAWAKARQDLAPGAWLASLEFAVPDATPTLVWTCPDGRPLWLYQVPAP
ncbi:MAG: methyltransferase type 12 [Polaromonas sp.]|nr:methyltransferase type 12 [Polaromonas sp.]